MRWRYLPLVLGLLAAPALAQQVNDIQLRNGSSALWGAILTPGTSNIDQFNTSGAATDSFRWYQGPNPSNSTFIFSVGTGGSIFGAPTGGRQGAGTINAQGVFINGVAPIIGVGGTNGQIQYNNAGVLGGFTTSGDATINTSSGVLTLATVNANVGTFGSATACVTTTVNAKGLTTAISAATCTPAIGSITGLGTGVATALAINVGSAGAFVTFNGAGGTPSSMVGTNITGTASGLTAGTANAVAVGNITGAGAGCITFLTTPSSANLRGCLNDESGTGAALFQSGDLGTPSAGVATNITALNATQLTTGIIPNARYNLTLLPEGRLTLNTGTPVMSIGNVTAAGTVFYTPYNGSLIPIYDGTNFTPTAFTELSNINANSATGNAGPAAVANNSCYDYFVWSNSGTVTLTRGPVWTNTSTRSAGTAIARTNGIYLNSVSITNGPAANRGTWVGTACSNGTATYDWINGAGASGGTAAVFSIWNYYNRVSMSTTVSDTGAGYTYTSATIRQARASAGNQITFVTGLLEDGFGATQVGQVNTVASAGATGLWGIGLNTTSAYTCGRTFGSAPTAATLIFGASASCNLMPALGLNIISANESSDGANANTFNNNSLNNLSATLRN